MDFREKVRDELKKRGSTIKWLADNLKIKYGVASRKFGGYSEFNEDDMKKISEFLGFEWETQQDEKVS